MVFPVYGYPQASLMKLCQSRSWLSVKTRSNALTALIDRCIDARRGIGLAQTAESLQPPQDRRSVQPTRRYGACFKPNALDGHNDSHLILLTSLSLFPAYGGASSLTSCVYTGVHQAPVPAAVFILTARLILSDSVGRNTL